MIRKLTTMAGAGLTASALTIGLSIASASPASATQALCPLGTVGSPGGCTIARPIPASVEAHGVRYVLPSPPSPPLTPGFPPLGAAAIGVVGGAGLAEAVRRLVARRRHA